MAFQAGTGNLGLFLGIAGAQALSSTTVSTEFCADAVASSATADEFTSSYAQAEAESDMIAQLMSAGANPLATGAFPTKAVTLQSPSGLVAYPHEGADLVRFARDLLENERRIPNGRVVIDTQHWSSGARVTDDGMDALNLLAEEFGITVCLKVNREPFVYELEPHAERQRQAELGRIAAKAKKGTKRDTVEHSMTKEAMEQRRSIGSWGADRIALDGLQNHLPSDSGGSKVFIRYLIGSRWHSRERGQELAAKGREVAAVAFSDNGRGFDYKKLGIDYSDKPDGESVGQFGEGLKHAIASALLEGMDVEVYSRNWRAVPEWFPILVDRKVVHRLRFEVEVNKGTRGMNGARTVFHYPSQDFLDFLSQVEEKVLHFRPGYEPIHSDENGNAVVDKEGIIYVKGMHVTSDFSERLLFSYDLNTRSIPRDRDHVKERVIGNLVGEMIAGTDDRELIKAYLERALTLREDEVGDPLPLEIGYIGLGWKDGSSFWRKPENPEAWKEAFHELFGERAVLWTDKGSSMTARLSNHDVVLCPNSHFRTFLNGFCGIPADVSVGKSTDAFLLADVTDASNAIGHTFETSFTLSYREKKWGALRLILDSFSNHMPADSGGTEVKVHVKIMKGSGANAFEWVEWHPGIEADKLAEIRITDDGRGYHFSNLRYAVSDKPSRAVGQFGEGLKMASAAALRAGPVMIKFRSSDWVATPFASAPMRVGRKDEEVLCFRVLEGVDSIKGSQTTVRGVDGEMGGVIARLDDYVLPLRSDQHYIYTSPGVRVFTEPFKNLMSNGTVYNKGIYITRSYVSKLLFSYDLNTDDVSPDRDGVDVGVLQAAVTEAVSRTTDRKAIERILEAASDGWGTARMEFVDAKLDEDVGEIWKQTFYGLFGENAVLQTSPDGALQAMHLGFRVVEMDRRIARTLHSAGIEYDVEVASEGLIAEEVLHDELDPQELDMIESFRDSEEVLGLPVFDNIRIFSAVRSRTGRDLSHKIGGFWDGSAIHIARRNLKSWSQANRIYVHERGHKETGKGDAADGFRHFFEYNVIALIEKAMEMKRGDPSYEVGIEGFARWEEERINELERENAELRAALYEQTKRAYRAEAKLANGKGSPPSTIAESIERVLDWTKERK